MGDDAEGGSAATATATSKPEKQKGGETKEGGGKGEGKKKDGKSKRGETNEGGEAKEGEGEGKKKGATSDAPVEVTATYDEGKAMLQIQGRHKGIWVTLVLGGGASDLQGVKVGDSIVRIDGKLLPPIATKTDLRPMYNHVMAIVGKQRPVTVDFRRGAHLTMDEYEASPEESRWTLKDLETAAAAYKEAVPNEEPKGDDGPTAKAGENDGEPAGDKNVSGFIGCCVCSNRFYLF